jgi:hypothetical protein
LNCFLEKNSTIEDFSAIKQVAVAPSSQYLQC